MEDDDEVVVLRGSCNDRESVPYKALDSLIDALCSHLRGLDDTDYALWLPDDLGLLVRLFPVMRRVGVVAKATTSKALERDDQQVRMRIPKRGDGPRMVARILRFDIIQKSGQARTAAAFPVKRH